jgi:hypothetical protein
MHLSTGRTFTQKLVGLDKINKHLPGLVCTIYFDDQSIELISFTMPLPADGPTLRHPAACPRPMSCLMHRRNLQGISRFQNLTVKHILDENSKAEVVRTHSFVGLLKLLCARLPFFGKVI